MNRSAVAVVEQAEAYASLFDRVSVGGRFDEASSDGPVRLASDQELLEATASVTRLIRLAEAERVKLAGEITRRSEVPDTSLAKRMGATNAAELVAHVAGVPREEGGSVVRLAAAVRSQEGLSGEPLPAKRACIAEALAQGRLDLTVASAMVRALRKSEPGLAPYEVDDLERQLVARAQEGYTADELLAFLRQVPSYAHPEGQDSRDEDLAQAASVSKRKLDNGLTWWILDLDPLTNGFFETALDANTSIRRFAIVESETTEAETDRDRRPLNRRRVDGVRLVAKRALKSDDGQQAGTAVTLVVTMSEEALKTGLGTATLPGCMDTISASTARMLAAEAEVVPVVLGGKSQPLDLGMSRRFFTEAQRRAMTVRSAGGCEGPCCDAPLAWCDAAHLRPAGWGPTSVDNGLLLCWRCHLLLDKRGWQVRRHEGRWWWTPPPWVDPTARERPGGRIPPLNLAA